MGWIRDAVRALSAGQEIKVRPKGAWIDSRFRADDELTLAPVEPAAVQPGEIVFVRWKSNPVLRLVLEVREGEVRIGKRRDDEGEWVPAGEILAWVTQIAKNYSHRDPVDPEICYDYLVAQWPLVEAWGDYRHTTFEFRAKRDWWEFSLSALPDYQAADIGYLTDYDLAALEEEGSYPPAMIDAARKLFVRSEQYSDAGSMGEEEVLRIVRECIAAYRSGAASAEG